MTAMNEVATAYNRLVGITDDGALYITRSDRSEALVALLSIHEHAELAEILTRTLRDRLDADSRLG